MGVYELSGAGSIKTGRTLYTSMNAGNQYGAMVPIAQATSSGSTSQLFFDNIPQTFQDLLVVGNVRTTAAVTQASTYLLINNNQSANRSFVGMSGDGSSAYSYRFGGSTFMSSGSLPGASATTGIFSSFNAYILNYANTTTLKSVFTRTACDRNGAGVTEVTCNLLQSSSPVTSLNVINDGFNNFAAGSTVTLYGIRAVSS
jgi:hypothetical protein